MRRSAGREFNTEHTLPKEEINVMYSRKRNKVGLAVAC